MTHSHERGNIDDAVRTCTRCPLAETRTTAVPGEGPIPARILFIGEAPGRNEDAQGRPFVGRAGKILDDLLAGIGVARGEVFITNIVKCRPPGNRDPTPAEIEACRPYLERQIALIRPEVIVTLGRFAMHWVLESHGVKPGPISEMHGKVVTIQWSGGERTVVPVYHPAATIYRPAFREVLAADFGTIREVIGDCCAGGGD
ncbi:uracil-DNA glycosylase [Methanomicrobiaceae archaeon CYW5]|uniref:uracil-DNA glycosylase n=1 Tax=Methanovulcanius yangii TaxID=1789227 RepID=UPI0029CA846F|nr:uracil-DNA glycosylase [Methanovulcanius yangii]MBT8506914.1 uracil-DNA glycosylase [Methanovulcanius yangii]